jgi:hypothetical protein
MLSKRLKTSNFIEFYKIDAVMVAKAARKEEIQIFNTALIRAELVRSYDRRVANLKVRTRPIAVTHTSGGNPGLPAWKKA